MSRSRELLLNYLLDLKKLEKGIYTDRFRINISDLLTDCENLTKMGHDNLLNNEDDNGSDDEILIPDENEIDVFNKEEIHFYINKKSISKNNNINNDNTNYESEMTFFPNSLLLEHSESKDNDEMDFELNNSTNVSITNKNNNSNTKKNPIHNIQESESNIWDIFEKVKHETVSESLDTLTTDTSDDDENVQVCFGCQSKNSLIEDNSGVIVCSKCGIIIEELMDYGPEKRQYNNEDNRTTGVNRCGCPSNYFFPKSSQGTIMVGTGSNRLKRKQMWNSMVYKERRLNLEFEYISHVCSKNNIPKIIVDSAKFLYKKISDCKHKSGPNAGKQIIIRGDNRISVIAACVFKACEANKNPRSIKEIAKFFNLDEKKVTKGNKHFDKIMKNENENFIFEQTDSNIAEDYIRRHCPKLKFNKKESDLAVKIANNCCRMKLASDHNPESIAAGSILLTIQYCKKNVDKKIISRLFGTSDVTITKIYNKIAPYVNALVNDEATDFLIEKFKING